MFKKILNGVYTFSLKKGVDFVLNKTTVDEKILETAAEIKRRAKNVEAEVKDVSKGVKNVVNQLDDVVSAVKGAKRKGKLFKKKKIIVK